ncbi:MAG: TonB-dependent receptor plug [Bacteroidetes bacterium]|nr:TonB-dependent receptor plug [Bacteroidota bacterium]
MPFAKHVFATIVMCLTLHSYAQTDIHKTNITATYTNAKLTAVISDLGNRYGIQFSYNPKVADGANSVTMQVKDMPFAAFMVELCRKASLEYEVINNNVILKKAAPKKTTPKQTIRGQVLDGATQQPIEGAIIRLDDSTMTIGEMTDSLGFFKLSDVPVGRRTFRISYLGYTDNVYPDMLVEASKEIILNVQMKDKASQLGEVAVYSSNRGVPVNNMAVVSATSISVEETKRFVASAFDPARVALNFAGVASSGDLNNELVVRGNSPKGVMYKMEGVEIVNPNHFNSLGSTGGAISMLSSSTLATCDFYTGAFPAEYGNALSGVMDLRLRSGNNEQREHSFMLGITGIEAATEGPFSKKSKASYIVNYRYSTLALLGKFISNLGPSAPDYQDLSFKINVPTTKAGTFAIWGLMGMNQAHHNAVRDTSKWLTSYDSQGFFNRNIKGSYGVTHKIVLNDKSYLQSVLSFSGQGITEQDYALKNDAALTQYTQADIAIRDYRIRLSEQYNYKMTARSTLRTGFIFTASGYNYNFHTWDNDSAKEVTTYASKGWTEMLQAYAQWQQMLSPKWTVNGGVHYTQLFLNSSFAIDPRFSVQYKPATNHTLAFAAGLHSKPEDLSTLLFNKTFGSAEVYLPNWNLKIPKAVHIVLGYTLVFAKDFQFKTELYYQYLFHQGVSQDSGSALSLGNASNFYDANFSNSSFISKGTGMNYGVDITLQKFFSKGYYFMATGSVFNSTYKTLTGKTYNTSFNRNYVVNVLGGKEFRVGKNKATIIGLNGKFLIMGGNPYSPIDTMQSRIKQQSIIDVTRFNQERTPLYYRLDLGVSFRFNTKHATHTLMLDIQNVTSHMNVWYKYYDTTTNKVQYLYQQGLLPIFNYRVEFRTK